jgi:hypothetical protein
MFGLVAVFIVSVLAAPLVAGAAGWENAASAQRYPMYRANLKAHGRVVDLDSRATIA